MLTEEQIKEIGLTTVHSYSDAKTVSQIFPEKDVNGVKQILMWTKQTGRTVKEVCDQILEQGRRV